MKTVELVQDELVESSPEDERIFRQKIAILTVNIIWLNILVNCNSFSF
jgi:hypothetical protein